MNFTNPQPLRTHLINPLCDEKEGSTRTKHFRPALGHGGCLKCPQATVLCASLASFFMEHHFKVRPASWSFRLGHLAHAENQCRKPIVSRKKLAGCVAGDNIWAFRCKLQFGKSCMFRQELYFKLFWWWQWWWCRWVGFFDIMKHQHLEDLHNSVK